MKIVNCTPHPIHLIDATGKRSMTFPPSGQVARVTSTAIELPEIAPGIPAVRHEWSAVAGLPDPEEGVLYAVSTMVADRTDRTDIVVPDSGPGSVVRDANGEILGVRRFTRPRSPVVPIIEGTEV